MLYKHDLISPRGGAAPKRSLYYALLPRLKRAAWARGCWHPGRAQWRAFLPAGLPVRGRAQQGCQQDPGVRFLPRLTFPQSEIRRPWGPERLSYKPKITQPVRRCGDSEPGTAKPQASRTGPGRSLALRACGAGTEARRVVSGWRRLARAHTHARMSGRDCCQREAPRYT